MMKPLRKIIDRLGGPAISIALHVIVIVVLVNVVVFKTMDTGREVEVQVVDAEESPEL
jgi:uncharacterized protein YggT (Ycf19 family)